jgi:hypothetical protein
LKCESAELRFSELMVLIICKFDKSRDDFIIHSHKNALS